MQHKWATSWNAATTLGLQGDDTGQFSSEEVALPSSEQSEEKVPFEQPSYCAGATQLGQALLGSPAYTGIMLILTVFALFGEDLRVIAFSASADDGFNGIASFTFFAFVFDLLLASLSRTTWATSDDSSSSANVLQLKCGIKGYCLSFFFWLDFVAALSLITEIPWIWSFVVGKQTIFAVFNCDTFMFSMQVGILPRPTT
jgi:hypothetical protein